MQNQPTWRLTWFKKYPQSRTTYARAPREIRIDPMYCPVRRRRTWEEHVFRQRTHPTWLNYPMLPPPESNKEPTESYMLQTLEQTVNQFKGVPDLACMMLTKICKMLIACIEDFHNSIHTRAPWTRFLEGRTGLSWNLQLAPTPNVLMGLFARLQFMPSHHMQTFEDAFYTGFFEYQTRVFGPLVHDLGARLVAYQAMELQNPLHDILEDAQRERDYQRYQRGLAYINRLERQQ